MSHYIHDYDVLNAIKAVLDADTTLDTLLAVVADQSKVVLGAERPKLSNLPVIHLFFLTRNIDTEVKQNQAALRVMWFVNVKPSGEEDIEKLSDIGERIYDLLDDNLFTLTNYQITVFAAESGESSALDLQRPEGHDNHFQSLTFNLLIKRNA